MRRILSFIATALFAISLSAVPANRKPFVVKQTDGTTLNIRLHGDESLHFHTTLDGKYLVKGECGSYFYASYTAGEGFVSTGVLAHNAAERSDAENALLSSMDYDTMADELSAAHASRSAKYSKSPVARSAAAQKVPTTGVVRIPVLLVEYSDVKFTFTKDNINRLLNEENYKYSFLNDYITSYGSARDYFIAQSGGLFQPEFVVSDILTLSKNMAYYGANNSEGDVRPREMIRDAITLADPNMDFSQFDNDGDGEVEFIYCIYAGYSEANSVNIDSNTIWPHQWDLESAGTGKKRADGVSCNLYACSSELSMNKSYEKEYGKYLAGIGTICHEFSHCLGLHDVYDVSGVSGNWGMDEWDLMDQGNYTGDGYIPVGYNSYQKEVCGWKKLQVLDKNGAYSMLPQTQGGVGYKIVNDANPNEYFILENRKREGWDQMMVSDGMMIIHVDYNATAWQNNEINVTKGHPRFQLVPADNELMAYPYPYTDEGEKKFYANLEKDLWPGSTRNTEFSNSSVPAAKVYTGGYLNKSVKDIKYENGVASFRFSGGDMPAPEVKPATDVAAGSFVANWTSIDEATEYLVELYKVVDAVDGEGVVEKLLEEDFMQCKSSNATIKDNLDEYTALPGWTGSNLYGENGRLRIGSKSNTGNLATPLLNAAGSITVSFKVSKYNTNDSAFSLVASVVDKSGSVIAQKGIATEGKAELTCNVDGDFKVTFNTEKTAVCRVVVDDITVSAVLPFARELQQSVTTADNSYTFSGLEQGKYAYRVKAMAGDDESPFSGYADVLLGATSVVEVQGTLEERIEVYSLDGTMKYQSKGNTLPVLPRGVYVIKHGAVVKKVFVK